MSEVVGKIRTIKETKSYGAKGFLKRELVVETGDKFTQYILMEFTQDNCEILDRFKVGDEVKIQVNINGRIWINPEKEEVIFNSINGWRIENLNNTDSGNMPSKTSGATSQDADSDVDDSLPF